MINGIYSALSGLFSFSRKVESTANNVANINTPGFKAGRVTLQDGPTQSVSTAAGSAQIGRGVNVSTIDNIFSQGSFESTPNPTDMGIGGQGFFMLRQPGSAQADKYTRSGGFQFNQEGYLVNPAGYYVQGWTIDPTTGERQGAIGDINMGNSTAPVATQRIEMNVNVDSRKGNENTDISLVDAWDGRNATGTNPTGPIDSTNYEYASAIKIYDSQGASHDITVYFDRTTNNNEWEFLVTSNPLEDHRNIATNQQASYAPLDRYTASDHKGAGALMYGTINFNNSGEIQNISAYNVPPDGQVDPALTANRIVLGGADSNYSFALNFTGDTVNHAIELSLGARYSGQGTSFIPGAQASTQYANSSTTTFQDQDGFAAGYLQSISVGTDGVVTGHYSNGQVAKKAQVSLATFNNPTGLFLEGGNLFSETTDSGPPLSGAPGSNALGGIVPNALEISNVELAEEIPNLMISKRFYQANLKVIQTADEMLGSLLDTKG